MKLSDTEPDSIQATIVNSDKQGVFRVSGKVFHNPATKNSLMRDAVD